MTGAHPDLGPELRQLAQAILDRLDPAVRMAAARAAAAAAQGPGRCQQVWCPVCALAAVVNGEEHPLLGVIAEHSVALLAVIRALLDDTGPGGDTDGPGPGPGDDGPGPGPDETPPTSGPGAGPGRYQPIPVTVEE
ncbi:hypothetical protein [Mycolicibacterium smegmatis]|uniref:Uncharacterized protein n=1 Tax=Mycolicibacterium smegmatis (strain MKD8) TaxID=1214915 RepID=A0A2U9PTK0_MYCSE|nr:hypothetical protein [Mycolicibacterium smegmatis]AWT55130.1 hypothetical protein D806_041650 [Mycolicibacterium smegmatis MKD8]MDF1903556.1 hypothetical protein [Mycolicibacterium smegmatis]MDF1910001.1 hypothetical protein [Mycolicibacterium smegmatis]MDF1921933.1 hypothetical protein [Mycolicibacterium smegmatis]MDF1928447.1 hypothetical protein [Mycolicibacterium smegmatis]